MSVDPGPAFEFFAACPRHVPELLGGELRALGLNVTREHPAGVSFSGPLFCNSQRTRTPSLVDVIRERYLTCGE